MNDIYILYCSLNDVRINHLFDSYTKKISNIILDKISSYKNPCNRAQCIIGYYLLTKGISYLNLDEKELFNIRLGAYGKPYIINDAFFFNISHSKNLVACIISNTSKVGIDIEYREDINYRELNIYSDKERTMINKSTYNKSLFYKIWTRKEAITKCIGCGLSTDLKAIDVTRKNVYLFNSLYSLYSVSMLNEYTCSYVIPRRHDIFKFIRVQLI